MMIMMVMVSCLHVHERFQDKIGDWGIQVLRVLTLWPYRYGTCLCAITSPHIHTHPHTHMKVDDTLSMQYPLLYIPSYALSGPISASHIGHTLLQHPSTTHYYMVSKGPCTNVLICINPPHWTQLTTDSKLQPLFPSA